MKIEFKKMHGCGNDYIYIDCIEKEPAFKIDEVAIKLSNRHFGVGGDGIVLICNSNKADAKMRMFNADGTEGKMCGNAIRCVAKYLYDNNIVRKEFMDIETLSGIKRLKLEVKEGLVKLVTVNMGVPEFKIDSMPLETDLIEVVSKDIEVENKEYKITCVSMGNPHCVIFLDGVKNLDVNALGPKFYKNEIFKDEVNIEFVEIVSKNEVNMRVHERGSKETLACGTGACAVVAAMVKNKFCSKDEEVLVNLLGGKLKICYKEDGIYMKGPAEEVFSGEVEI